VRNFDLRHDYTTFRLEARQTLKSSAGVSICECAKWREQVTGRREKEQTLGAAKGQKNEGTRAAKSLGIQLMEK